ncbi:tRNA (adenosine(37)-N6)-threonylcarbamoyltransferase complex ATPase subunit type 1 TsaE [Pseudolysinimonas kribbensis]|uniref:tRNA threonylcarbamoyladenosine biosynthesis protein TsaE n=2 Tax=Pseudolysinimonas kribbensis TaxID=433641 RepID=A0ABQ6K8K1_9MICO|nr:tRNA threonylcarbamoyladenosine biosynthesis protein TsaE [Pseudolysinimonas kribbensis]
MSDLELTIADPEAMEALGERLARELRAGDLVLLEGELGAGKTTLTRGIGRGLGARGAVTSPTFVLAREHPTASGPPLVHVDAYRLGSAAELDDLDLDLERSIVVVEWPNDRVDADSWLRLRIERPAAGDPDAEAEPRRVTIDASGARWAPVLNALGS